MPARVAACIWTLDYVCTYPYMGVHTHTRAHIPFRFTTRLRGSVIN